MSETITYTINDTNRAIGKVADDLKGFDSDRIDGRIKSMILTKLEEAQLLSLKLIKELE